MKVDSSPEKDNIIDEIEKSQKPADSEKDNFDPAKEEKFAEMEKVMNSSMEFFSGLYKMTTGKSIGDSGHKIDVNRKT